MEKNFNFKKEEDNIYAQWEKSGYFNPDNLNLPKKAKTYSIVLPPPNITDKLHMGHASMLAIEDLMIRFRRMKGYKTLWIPGTDHAAIATQNVVEKKLLKETGKTRHDLGKEKFLKEVWKFLKITQATILHQTKKMGSSLDWSREAFTLDETRQKSVTKMFVEMYEAGLIYQGKRLVNWCPRCHSTLADDEVEYENQETKLYTFKYSADFPIPISTTRPETKLGDTAVAVNPKDKRYKKYIGQIFKVDFCGINLAIKIIADREVDMEFGTGAVGVTPAHSFVDARMAEKNQLKIVEVIDEDGKIKINFGKFSGKTVLEAREMIIKELKSRKLLLREEKLENNLSVCYRCGTAIEPILSTQWFVAVDKKIKKLGNKSLKEKAIEVVKSKKINFLPGRFEKRYLDWMKNLHDWCISRQLWFGHSIPVWYKNGEIFVGEKAPQEKGWKQDSDTLDTWFSSGMWTFSTLGWPDNFKNGKKSGDLAKFHPTQVLETGYEIITLWVSRMIMMSLFAVGEIPFETVYLHGLILDKNGKKMSKSKGNGIDPINMIEKYGADATRLSVLIGSTPGNDVRLSEEKIESFRNLVTKLWNICRYAKQSDNSFSLEEEIKKSDIKSLSDKWILSKLNILIKETTSDLEKYRFGSAGEKLRDFTWNELADWYVEINKLEKNPKVLGFILEKLLKLWHPFIPFVTEEIWKSFREEENFLMVAPWPKANKNFSDKKAEKEFFQFQSLTAKIRNIRSVYKIDPYQKLDLYGKNFKEKVALENLAKVKFLDSSEEKQKMILVQGNRERFFLDVSSFIDIGKEVKKAKEEIENLKKVIAQKEKMLANKNFVSSAPKKVIQSNQEKLKEYQEKIENQKRFLKNIQSLI